MDSNSPINRFSAFWLRLSVVLVLISLIIVPSEMNKSIWEMKVAETKSTTGEKHMGLEDKSLLLKERKLFS